MLIDILKPFCDDTGYDIVQQRSVALEIINRAAQEVYNTLEANSGLSEVTLVVPRNMQLSLPYYVGQLRGIREYKWGPTIDLNSMASPRYMSNMWKSMWNNWRDKQPSPVHTISNNTGALTLEIAVANSEVVEIAMQTVNSARVVESVTMDNISKVTTNTPIKILSISSPTSGRLYDITIKDIDGTELAKLHNNQNKTRYKVIDVSEFQWRHWTPTSEGEPLVELLYKPMFTPFYYDTDEFVALDYDAAIQYKAMELYYTGGENKLNEVIGFGKKSTQQMNQATKNEESGQQAQINFQPNSTYKAFDSIKGNCGYGGPYIPYTGGNC